MRVINKKGLNLIKKWEGCAVRAYPDLKGIPTIGYGHTGPEVHLGLVWNQIQIEAALISDLEKFYKLEDHISDLVNDNQFSALICLTYNEGLNAVLKSKTLKLVNSGQKPDIEWLDFNKVNGVINKGLTNRRKAELVLYHEIG